MSRTVVITGGCGFVGTNLVAHLNRTGRFRVRVIDNESLGKRAHLNGLDAEFISGDILRRADLDRVLADADAVVHLAADTRVIDSIEDPRRNFEANVAGTFNLLEAMRDHGIKRLINASTGGAILGEVEPPVHEEMVPRPMAPYGASKLAVEGYCSAFAGSYGMNTISLRFSNVYGPRSFHKGSVVAHFFKQILSGKPLTVYGDGSQVRDYVYAGDLCAGIEAAISADVSGTFQLGSGKPTSINELIDLIKGTVAGRHFDVRYEAARTGELHRTWCDISKAERDLRFQPTTDLGEGLATTWQWFEQQAGRS